MLKPNNKRSYVDLVFRNSINRMIDIDPITDKIAGRSGSKASSISCPSVNVELGFVVMVVVLELAILALILRRRGLSFVFCLYFSIL